MTVLALADIHGVSTGLELLADLMRRVDLVLVAGDLTDFGGAEELQALLPLLAPARDRLAAVPGNCDRRGARQLLEQEGLSVDGRVVERGGARVVGTGGGILHTGLTPYERREEELTEALQSAWEAHTPKNDGAGPLVVLSHMPPRDSGADRSRSGPTGSRGLRQFLDAVTPPLWVCGHIHESRSAQRRGDTLIVNPGPLRIGCYALVDLCLEAGGVWRAEAELPILDTAKRS